MNEMEPESDRTVPASLVWVGGIACLVGGLAFLRPERLDATGVSLGILLLTTSLALLSVAVGQRRYGPETEGRLDLSTRLATGLLGGAIGGIVYLAVAWMVETSGLTALLGVGLEIRMTSSALVGRVASGAAWGLAFGVLLPWLPGRSIPARGLLFSLLPALWVLFRVFPHELQYGVLGGELGALTFLPVLLYHAAWGVTAASVVAWAEAVPEAPLSRPLGA